MKNVKNVQTTIDADLADWFDANFSFATKQKFLEQCFLHLRAAVESGALPIPNAYAAYAGVNAAKTLIETEAENGSHRIRSETSET